MRRIISFLLALTFCTGVFAQTSPDFAFPKKVETASARSFEKNLKSGNYPEATRSLMNLILAKSEIDNTSIASSVQTLRKTAAESRDSVFKGMLTLLEAEITADIYYRKRYVYDERNLPLTPLPDNIFEWSGDQFKGRIAELCGSVCDLFPVLEAVPLEKWKSVIDYTPEQKPYYPTLLQFAAYRVLSLSETLGERAPLYPRMMSESFGGAIISDFSATRDKLAYRCFTALSEAAGSNSLLQISEEARRLRWVASGLQSGDYRTSLRNSLLELYTRFESDPASAIILVEMYSPISDDIKAKRQLWDLTDLYQKRFPDNIYYKEIKALRASLKQPSSSARFRTTVARGRNFDIFLNVQNCDSVTLDIYRIARNKPNILASDLTDVVRSITLRFDNSVPFSCDTTVTATLDDFGLYTILIRGKENRSRGRYFPPLCVTDLFISTFVPAAGEAFATIRDFTTGAPLSGANVLTYKNSNSVFAAVSNSEGKAVISRNGNEIYARRDNDRFARPVYFDAPYIARTSPTIPMTTSLPVYHPGDSVQFTGFVWKMEGNSRKVSQNTKVSYRIYNPNFVKVDSGYVMTDRFGRFSAKTRIPEEGLTGRYRIIADNGKAHGYYTFTVADYKLPTFLVTIKQIPDSLNGNVILKGNATTFSGFPVSDAETEITVTASDRWRFFFSNNPENTVYTTTVRTDADGEFTVTIPRDSLPSAEIAGKILTAYANVTSAASETRTASTVFTLSKPYTVVFKASDPYNLTSGKPLYVIMDIQGKEIGMKAGVSILKGDSVIMSMEGGDLKRLRTLPSSSYRIRVTPADTTLVSAATSDDMMMYNPDNPAFDSDRMMFIPDNNITIQHGGKGEFLFGTSADTLYVERIITGRDSIISRDWVTVTKGFRHIPFSVPADRENAQIILSAVRDGNVYTSILTATAPSDKEALKITFESFRDKIISGSTEKWTIRTEYKDGTPVQSAVILDILSKAITEIENVDPLNIGPLPLLFNYTTGYSNNYFNYINGSYAPLHESPSDLIPSAPDFNTYGIAWNGRNTMHIRGTRRYYKSSAVVMEDAAVEEDMSTNMLGASATMADMAVVRSDSDAGSVEGVEVVEEEKAEEQTASADKDSYRPAEMPLALFNPTLATDKKGRLEFSFTLPEATTTWEVFSYAFTEDISFASDRRSMTASKPVMVSTAAPRFLRAGDSAILAATVMNASGEELKEVKVISEVLDATESKVLAADSVAVTIDKNGKYVARLLFDVPENIPGAVYRVKAVAGVYTDGEQNSFPVLPATERVVEATPFYISPDSTTTVISIDNTPGMTASIEYCENAAWSVVQALPGIVPDKAITANQAAMAIFSAAVADGIVRRNPAIAAHISRLAETQGKDSVAIAALLRNEDVKLALLASTPWVQDAMTDAERITRLSLILSRKEISSEINRNVKILAKLVRQGGWSWCGNSEKPSRWVTENVLTTLAMLKQLGFTPSDSRLQKMTDEALSWLDSEIVSDNRNRTKPDVNIQYTYIRTIFSSQRIPTSARRTIDATVKYLVENALSLSESDKGSAAIILDKNGYSATARRLLDSLREFSTTTPLGEVCWKNIRATQFSPVSDIMSTSLILDAFALITPSDPVIDGIRLWMINEKSRRDWGDSRSATFAIASILGSGSDWTPPAVPRASIRINDGEPLGFSKTDLATGYFRSVLPNGKLQIRVDKVGKFPAYGAVYQVGDRANREIKPLKMDGLSIVKETLVLENGKWTKAGATLTPGSRVKNILTVNSEVDLSYVVIANNRPACFEPVRQLPHSDYSQGIFFYKEPRTSVTNIFVDFLPRGTYVLEEEFNVDREGTYAAAAATLQSNYAPAYSVRSGAAAIRVAGR